MDRFLKYIALFTYKYRVLILAASALSAVVSIYAISKIELKTDLMDVFPSDNPSMRLFADTLNDFGTMKALTVVFQVEKGKDIEDYFPVIEGIGSALSASAMIDYADYNIFKNKWDFIIKHFPLYLDKNGIEQLKGRLSREGIAAQIERNYKTLQSPLASIPEVKMIEEDPLDLRTIIRAAILTDNADKMDVSAGFYLSKDHTLALMFVSPRGSSRDMGFVKSLKSEVDSIVSKHAVSGLKIGFTGSYALAWETRQSMDWDILTSTVSSALLVFLIFRFVYGARLLGIAVNFIGLAIALLWTFAAAYFLYGSLNIITSVVTAMLIGMGIDYTVHFYDRYACEYARTTDPCSALVITVSNTGKGIITGALTTAAAFFSVIVTSFNGLHEMGVVAGIGIVATLVSTIFVMGALLPVTICFMNLQHINGRQSVFLEKALPDFIMRNAKPFVILLIAANIVSAFGIARVRFVSDLADISLRDSAALRLQQVLSEKIGRDKMPLFIVYKGKASEDSAFDTMEAALRAWKDSGLIGGYNSLSALMPPPSRQKEAIAGIAEIPVDAVERTFVSALDKYGFVVTEKNLAYIKGIKNALLSKEPVSIAGLISSGNKKADYFYKSGKLAAYIYPTGVNWSQVELDKVRQAAPSIGKGDSGWFVTGWPLLSGELKGVIIRESLAAAVISGVIILALVYFHFRRPKKIFLSIMPLISSMVVTLGVMGYAGIGFNYINMASIAILLGIGIDYGVYMMQAANEMDGATDNGGLARSAYRNIIICALTTIAGFGSLITVSFKGISSLAWIINIGVAANMIMAASLFLVIKRQVQPTAKG
ncbi:MAG: MMPL family transporter [Nitrospirae bacterium]|nr:MMPL family transporter [Nitrospirota bacterium]